MQRSVFASSASLHPSVVALGVCVAVASAACKNPDVAAAPPSTTTPTGASPSAAESPPSTEGNAMNPPNAGSPTPSTAPDSLHTLRAKRIDGTDVAFSDWAGKVLLVVNTASECGYTPQYEGLQALHAKYESRGFAVLGFPSNDFGGQEPGTSQQIVTFCKTRFGVTFPLFEKVKTKGAEASPVYALLGKAMGEPRWNFHKYLVDKKGMPVAAWPSSVAPDSPELTRTIEAQLAAL